MSRDPVVCGCASAKVRENLPVYLRTDRKAGMAGVTSTQGSVVRDKVRKIAGPGQAGPGEQSFNKIPR